MAIQAWKPKKIAVSRVNLGAVVQCGRSGLGIGQQIATSGANGGEQIQNLMNQWNHPVDTCSAQAYRLLFHC